MRIAPKMRFPTCSVCNESVELETSKSDAHGKAAHEECYIVKVTGEAARSFPRASWIIPLAYPGTKEKALQRKQILPPSLAYRSTGLIVVVNRRGC
jgi:hypothetical protein